MRVLVAGGTGFIGGHLVRALIARGDLVTVLSRDVAAARRELPRECRVAHWDPGHAGHAHVGARSPWFEELPFVDGVINLVGAPIAHRWTDEYKKKIRDSRLKATESLVEAIALAGESKARNAARPRVLINASGVGYYGMSTKREVDEGAAAGGDFLAKVCEDWEAAAQKAEDHGVRVVRLRKGVVLGRGGGLVREMVPLGLIVVGPIGKGDNSISWVHVDDVVGMMTWALDDDTLSGAINCTSPHYTTGRELARSMASVLDKRSVPVPESLLRMRFGSAVDAMIGSQKVFPKRAIDKGYEYHFARLVPALEQSMMGES
jgi:uncharacterized protein (TIGR01777 family)